jgi:hypothetical protein
MKSIPTRSARWRDFKVSLRALRFYEDRDALRNAYRRMQAPPDFTGAIGFAFP